MWHAADYRGNLQVRDHSVCGPGAGGWDGLIAPGVRETRYDVAVLPRGAASLVLVDKSRDIWWSWDMDLPTGSF